MATLVTRSGKGSPLTHAEVDANFTNLNTDKLELSGGTMTGNLSFGDNDKAIFGAGSDLQIYHDGSNSFIDEAGTGNLRIRASSALNLQTRNTADTAWVNSIIADDGAGVRLFTNGSKKLETTSTGIDVTGTVTADGLTVDTTNNSILRLRSNDTAQASLDEIGTIRFESDDGSITETVRNEIVAVIKGTSANTELYFKSSETNNLRNRMMIDFNGDISFYEDTGTTAKFFWDASAEALALGTSTSVSNNRLVIDQASGDGQNSGFYMQRNGGAGTSFKIDIDSSDVVNLRRSATTAVAIDSSGNVGIGNTNPSDYDVNADNLVVGTTSGNNGISIASGTTGLGSVFFADATSGVGLYRGLIQYNHSSDYMRFFTTSAEAMRIDSSGNVGIGTSSPSGLLELKTTTSNAYLYITADNASSSRVYLGDEDNATIGRIGYNHGFNFMDFYTNGSERMRIDSSGNVGIGTSSPSAPLHIKGGGDIMRLESTGATGNLYIDFYDTTARKGYIGYGSSSTDDLQFYQGDTANMVFYTSGAERMRIDSSGNLLVGTTTVNGEGISIRGGVNNYIYASRGGAESAYFDRLNNDGKIIEFRKDGTTVGSIGSASGNRIYIGTGNSTLGFSPVVDAVYGYSGDNTVDLGTSATRFKDLYLSGGVYLGGTGAANKLDDYEEGTWTSSLQGSSTAGTWTPSGGTPNARYVKIGKVYFITFEISGSLSGASGEVQIRGLPTVSSANDQGWYATYWSGFNTAQIWIGGHLTASGDGMWVKGNTAAATEMGGVSVSELGTGTVVIRGVAVIEEI